MSWIDRVFEAAYGKFRRRYVETMLAISGAGVAFLAWPAQQLTQFPLWGPGGERRGEMAFLLLIGLLIAIAACLNGVRVFFPIIRFLQGNRVEPTLVWHAAVRSLPAVAMENVLLFCILGNVPAVLMAGQHRGFDPWTYIGAWLAASGVTLTAGFFYILIWEVALRPVLREVDPLLPANFAPGAHWLTLTRRSAIATTSVMLYTGIAVSGLVAGYDGLEERLWMTVLWTLVAAGTFGGVITALVSHSIFSRVSDVKEALVRMGGGDFDVRVALRMGDELDEAARVLNATALRLKHQDAQLRESRARLTSVEDDERRRMERDLRVGVDQRLESLAEQLRDLEATLREDELEASCAEVRASLNEARSEIRALAHGIFPVLLESEGLREALQDAVVRAGLKAYIDLGNVGRMPPEIEAAAYFCCSEALQNVAKHAGPGAHVKVQLVARHRVLQFTVMDDGVGFEHAEGGHGLTNMRDRLRAVGGDVNVSSMPGVGTTVTGWLTMSGVPAMASR
jgi:signal transduction histidine kinase